MYVAEGDLDQIFEEEEVNAALASYKEVREALKNQKINRGYYPKGKGGWSKGKGKGKSKVHIKQLKLRTRCWRCGAIGHISRECNNPPVDRNKGSGSSQAPTNSSSASTKSGFPVISEAPDEEDEQEPNSFLSLSHTEDFEVHDFWLREFVEKHRREHGPHIAEAETKSEYKGAQSSTFCGITTRSHHGIVDTAAEGGLIGTCALERLQECLKSFGLQYVWTSKKSSAKGVGGPAKVHGVVYIPIGVGGVNGVLEATVVEGEVPLLLPVKMMKSLRVIINFTNLTFHLSDENTTIDVRELPSGHVTIEVSDFHEEGFSVDVSNAPFCTQDFIILNTNRAMLAQLSSGIRDRFAPILEGSLSAQEGCHVGNPRAHGQADAFHTQERRTGAARLGVWSSPKEGVSQLESDARQDLRAAMVCRKRATGAVMVPRILVTFGAVYAAIKGGRGGDARACVFQNHNRCQDPVSFEVQGSSKDGHQLLHAPEASTQGRRQCDRFVRCVQDVPLQVGEQHHLSRIEEDVEGGQTEGPLEPNISGTIPGDRAGCQQQPGHQEGTQPGVREGEGQRSGQGELPGGYGRIPEDVQRDERSLREAVRGDARRVESAEAPHGGERDDSREGTGSCTQTTGPSTRGNGCTRDPTSRNNGSELTEMPLQQDRRASSSAQRGTAQRKEVLEVHATRMPVLRMDAKDSKSASERERDELLSGDSIAKHEAAHIRVKKEEQESTDSREEGCGPERASDRRLKEEETDQESSEEEVRWMIAKEEKARRNLRKMQTGRSEHFIAQFEYEIFEEDTENWKKKEGLVPLREERAVRLRAELRPRWENEEWFEVIKETQFTGPQRKRLMKQLNHAVGEVYSPPRVSKEGEKKGIPRATCFDLLTGWDLSRPEHVKKMWQTLKKERPKLLVICPPCTAFTPVQELNFPNMSWGTAVRIIATGLEHLELAAKVALWQHRQGGYFVLEQPKEAKSWKEECLKKLEEIPGIWTEDFDQCMYGLQVDQLGLNKKPTKVLVNSDQIAKQLRRKCDKKHFHAPTMNGRPKLAQVYPKKMCEAIIKGFIKQMQDDGEPSHWAAEEGEEEEEDEEEPLRMERETAQMQGEGEGSRSINDEDRRMVDKLHRGLGHPASYDFIRFMKAARIRPEVIQWTHKQYKCSACEARPKPKTVRRAALPRTYQPNQVLGLDLIYLPDVGGKKQFPALSIVDWGSNYQMIERVENKQPETIWEAFWSSWARTFGLPEVMIVDGGKEFSQRFCQFATAHGVVVQATATKAPWQNGKTERHGAHYKELLQKSKEETVVTTEQELKLLMQEVEMVKNRYSNRSGFSPIQRQIGQWPKVPSTLISDDLVEPGLMDGAIVDDIERTQEMRRMAQKAFIEHNAKEATKRIMNSRGKSTQEFKPGEYVYVYRMPRIKKRKHDMHPEQVEKVLQKNTWIGPGTVLVVDGSSLWISMFGELWRAAREQCRPATNIEKAGVEEAMQDCKALIEEYKRSSNRKGYKDIREEEWPKEEDEEDAKRKLEEEDEPQKRRRIEEESKKKKKKKKKKCRMKGRQAGKTEKAKKKPDKEPRNMHRQITLQVWKMKKKEE